MSENCFQAFDAVSQAFGGQRIERVVRGEVFFGEPFEAVVGGVAPFPNIREDGGLGGVAFGFIVGGFVGDVVVSVGVPRRVEINQIGQFAF